MFGVYLLPCPRRLHVAPYLSYVRLVTALTLRIRFFTCPFPGSLLAPRQLNRGAVLGIGNSYSKDH
jgi:hypothetical protein